LSAACGHTGPACNGLNPTPANACQRGEFAGVRALGGVDPGVGAPRLPPFCPVSASLYWKEHIDWLMSLGLGATDGLGRRRRVVSPAMAYFARPDPNASHSCVGVDPRRGRPPGGYYCKGWLHAFKQATLAW